jgi:hypothetical protein
MNTMQPVQMGEDHSDDEDSMSDDSTTDHSMKEDADSTRSAASDHLVQDETKAVNFSKMLVYKILLITGAALGVAMYFFLSGKEKDDFESQVCCLLLRSSMQLTGQINMHSLTLRTLIMCSSIFLPRQ